MKKYNRNNLNIKRLLELNVLDIRKIAEQNETLTANEYFSKVEQFIEIIPQMIKSLSTISELKKNIDELKELEAKLGVSTRSVDFSEASKKLEDLTNLKNIMAAIGYGKLDTDINFIYNAIKSGDFQLAEGPSSEALVHLITLSEKLKASYSKKKFATSKAAEGDLSKEYDSVLLSEALEYFDHLEAHRKLRILAVDDISVVLNSITSILSPYYEVYALKNSSQVENFLMHTTPELFLLDIEMKEVSGFDLIPLIRRFDKHKNTPIIFLTGNASYNNLKDAISLGASDFITKPIDKNILLEKIEKNIVKKKAY